MAMLKRDGVRIHYEFHRAESDQAPVMLLSHGYSASSAMWQAQIEPMRARCHVLTWDMRGHGASDSPDGPEQYSEAHTVADMAALLDTCGAERALIGGLSLGGYMSLAFQRRHPDRCLGLLLFDTGPGYKSDSARAGWNANALAQARALESSGFAALSESAEVRAAGHRSVQGLAHAARGMLAQVDDRVIRSLPEIKTPTLVLVGENDAPFRVPSEYMASRIPNAQLVVLPGAGHASNIDQPFAFTHAVLSFIDELTP